MFFFPRSGGAKACVDRATVALDQKIWGAREAGAAPQLQPKKRSSKKPFYLNSRFACFSRCLRTRYPAKTDDARDGLLDEATQAAAFLLFAELSSPTSALLPPLREDKRPGWTWENKIKKDNQDSGTRARRTGQGKGSAPENRNKHKTHLDEIALGAHERGRRSERRTAVVLSVRLLESRRGLRGRELGQAGASFGGGNGPKGTPAFSSTLAAGRGAKGRWLAAGSASRWRASTDEYLPAVPTGSIFCV